MWLNLPHLAYMATKKIGKSWNFVKKKVQFQLEKGNKDIYHHILHLTKLYKKKTTLYSKSLKKTRFKKFSIVPLVM